MKNVTGVGSRFHIGKTTELRILDIEQAVSFVLVYAKAEER
jgi:hypothetical protein